MSAPHRRSSPGRVRWLRNRFVLVPLLLVIMVAGWNLWVFNHNHGIVTGRVVDATGAPVPGATVRLWVFNFTTFVEQASVTTDADGRFRFAGNPSHNIQISAERADIGRTDRVSVRLYFASEDRDLSQPLRLSKG